MYSKRSYIFIPIEQCNFAFGLIYSTLATFYNNKIYEKHR